MLFVTGISQKTALAGVSDHRADDRAPAEPTWRESLARITMALSRRSSKGCSPVRLVRRFFGMGYDRSRSDAAVLRRRPGTI
jgi:hypothetical protein